MTPTLARPAVPGAGSAAVCLMLALGGCTTLGPDYQPPETPLPARWVGSADSAAAEAAQLAVWWRQLRDPRLDGLMESALSANPDLKTARARLSEARARRDLAEAGRSPTLTASASASRAKGSAEAGSGATRNHFSAGFDASWEADVFGGLGRGVEAAQADLEASQAGLGDAQVSLAAEVALNYVQLRAAQARLAIARDNLDSQAETLQLTQWRAQAGLVTGLDVDQARTALEQTRSQLPALETGAAEARHRLAILLGRAPGALDVELEDAGAIPTVPDRVLAGIPADTLRQRPDVRAAERRLAAETARIGVAEANRYPGFTLSGSLGLDALTLGGLTGGDALAASVLGQVAGTIFDAGRLRRQVDIQGAVRDQALAAYEAAVLTALEEVENALAALANHRRRLLALDQAAQSAASADRLARQQYAAGLVDFQTVLNTQRSLLSTQDGLQSGRADLASALIQLYKALGGGWTAAPETPGMQDRKGGPP